MYNSHINFSGFTQTEKYKIPQKGKDDGHRKMLQPPQFKCAKANTCFWFLVEKFNFH